MLAIARRSAAPAKAPLPRSPARERARSEEGEDSAGQSPAGGAVEPDQPPHGREARQRGEHVGDPGRLAAARLGRGGLADHHRLARSEVFGDAVRSRFEDARERPPRVVAVVAVEACPVDVGAPGVQGGDRRRILFGIGVRAPHPRGVARACPREDAVDMAPGRDVGGRVRRRWRRATTGIRSSSSPSRSAGRRGVPSCARPPPSARCRSRSGLRPPRAGCSRLERRAPATTPRTRRRTGSRRAGGSPRTGCARELVGRARLRGAVRERAREADERDALAGQRFEAL